MDWRQNDLNEEFVSIIIENLSSSVKWRDLKNRFKRFGRIVHIYVDWPSQRAFIRFLRRGDAERAVLSMNDVLLKDRPMKVSLLFEHNAGMEEPLVMGLAEEEGRTSPIAGIGQSSSSFGTSRDTDNYAGSTTSSQYRSPFSDNTVGCLTESIPAAELPSTSAIPSTSRSTFRPVAILPSLSAIPSTGLLRFQPVAELPSPSAIPSTSRSRRPRLARFLRVRHLRQRRSFSLLRRFRIVRDLPQRRSVSRLRRVHASHNLFSNTQRTTVALPSRSQSLSNLTVYSERRSDSPSRRTLSMHDVRTSSGRHSSRRSRRLRLVSSRLQRIAATRSRRSRSLGDLPSERPLSNRPKRSRSFGDTPSCLPPAWRSASRRRKFRPLRFHSRKF